MEGPTYFLFCLSCVNEDTDINKDDLTIESRCLSIFACLAKGQMMPDELIEALHLPDAQFHHVVEDMAHGRIYQGYNNVSDNVWVNNLPISFKITNILHISGRIAQTARWNTNNVLFNDSRCQQI